MGDGHKGQQDRGCPLPSSPRRCWVCRLAGSLRRLGCDRLQTRTTGSHSATWVRESVSRDSSFSLLAGVLSEECPKCRARKWKFIHSHLSLRIDSTKKTLLIPTHSSQSSFLLSITLFLNLPFPFSCLCRAFLSAPCTSPAEQGSYASTTTGKIWASVTSSSWDHPERPRLILPPATYCLVHVDGCLWTIHYESSLRGAHRNHPVIVPTLNRVCVVSLVPRLTSRQKAHLTNTHIPLLEEKAIDAVLLSGHHINIHCPW